MTYLIEAVAIYMSFMQKLKELIKLSNLCNFQLFASIEGKYQPSKTAKLLGGKKVNEPYIPCKTSSFYKKISLKPFGLKFSEKLKLLCPFNIQSCYFIRVIR